MAHGRRSEYHGRDSRKPIIIKDPDSFLKGIDVNINDKGKKFVKECFQAKNGNKPVVTMTQLRKFLSAVNSISNKIEAKNKIDNPDEIQYLRTKMAYQVGRADKKSKGAMEQMFVELDPIISRINKNPEYFKRFAMLIEAIVAYHKFYGGDN